MIVRGLVLLCSAHRSCLESRTWLLLLHEGDDVEEICLEESGNGEISDRFMMWSLGRFLRLALCATPLRPV